MRTQSNDPAFSTRSIFFLLMAAASALVSIVREYQMVWTVAEWICGISVLALIASLIADARK
ncbi:MAG TPA: hypothetical protein VME63_04470 [Dyella sp.]|uniref:hypothetical protein n=1 Tax=Dyella sp. TaxID=1869338 RepID=UPI002C71BCC7|nr:hypothetical protein [Dyella sp.]HTV84633.1 hypothetical protein [Dyella sp.]